MLSLYICAVLDLQPAVFAGVAAILAVQPSIYRSWKQMGDQISANVLGAAISLFFIYFFGDNPITIGFVIMLVISISIKLKMEKTIPLTLITVLAIMSAPGTEDWFFALDRFLIILIGTASAILVNLAVLPPKYQKNYLDNVHKAFLRMSLLVRTAISNEMTEASFQEENKLFKKDVQKLGEQFDIFDEERVKLGKLNQLHAREIIVYKHMLKSLKEAEQLIDNIEEHFFPASTNVMENELFDKHLENLVKWHEHLILKFQGRIKEQQHIESKLLPESDAFYEQVLQWYAKNKEQKQRLMIIASSVMDYTFHLHRLSQVISQYLKAKD